MHPRTIPIGLTVLALAFLAAFVTNTEAKAADPPRGTPTVVYLDPNGGMFKGGKRLLAAPCWSMENTGAMDYSKCCPDGFAAVGLTVDGNLACLMR